MATHEIVSEAQWIEARRALLAEEKATRRRRKLMDWVKRHDRYENDGRTQAASGERR